MHFSVVQIVQCFISITSLPLSLGRICAIELNFTAFHT